MTLLEWLVLIFLIKHTLFTVYHLYESKKRQKAFENELKQWTSSAENLAKAFEITAQAFANWHENAGFLAKEFRYMAEKTVELKKDLQ